MSRNTLKDNFEIVSRHGRLGTLVVCPECGVYTVWVSPEERRHGERNGYSHVRCDGCAAYREHLA